MKRVNSVRRNLLLASIVGVFTPLSRAQGGAYPSKPVKVIVGFPPGSSTDSTARLVSQRLGASLSQSFYVDNRPGAHGQLATDALKSSPKDGYTLLYASGGMMVIGPALHRGKLRYDPLRDFIPIGGVDKGSLLLAVRSSLPVKNLQEMIALVKNNPGKFTYGSAGVGSTSNVTMERLKLAEKLDITHVPYRGGGQVLQDLMGGQLDFTFDAASVLLPYKTDSRIRLIATTSKSQMKVAPGLQPMSDIIPGFEAVTFSGLFAPVGTPPDVIKILNQTINAELKKGSFSPAVEDVGAEPNGGTQEEFRQFVSQQYDQWKKIIADTGVTPE